MLASWGADRHTRRHSSTDSTNRSSFVTIKKIDSSRSPSSPRPDSAAGSSYALHGVGESRSYMTSPRSRSSSAKRSSGPPSLRLDDGSSERKRASNRLSQSTISSQDSEKRRRKGASTRYSLAPSSLSVASTTDRHVPQPIKKRRPGDINTAASRNLVPNPGSLAPAGSALYGGTAYPLESPLPSLDQFADTLRMEPPRTPLLFDTQIARDETSTASDRQVVTPTFDIARYQREAAVQRESDLREDREDAEAREQADAYNYQTTSGTDPPVSSENIDSRRSPERTRQRRSKNQSQASVALSDLSKPSSREKRASKDRDKKTMLALALQRANDAVQLDNTEDFQGAITAYVEACDYLTQVMDRSSSSDDQGKLSAIRTTYTERIYEIRQLGLGLDLEFSHGDQDEALETVSARHSVVDGNQSLPLFEEPGVIGSLNDESEKQPRQTVTDLNHSLEDPLPSASSYSSLDTLKQPFVPAPLSPRRPSPQPPIGEFAEILRARDADPSGSPGRTLPHQGLASGSWLDGLGQRPATSGSSSSHHSMSSLRELRRKHLKTHSSGTEAEFDAALDAAVEAAYDDGYEPYMENPPAMQHQPSEYMFHEDVPRDRDPYLAGRADRVVANKRRLLDRHAAGQIASKPEPDLDSDEEDQLLQEGQDYISDNYSRDSQPRSRLPRQSDSSSSSGRTWGSSVASSLNTTGTPLSPVDENSRRWTSKHLGSHTFPPPVPPPTAALPLPPGQAPILTSSTRRSSPQTQASIGTKSFTSVQDRRSSGQKGKRLKIETSVEAKAHQFGPGHDSVPHPGPLPPKTAPGALVSIEDRVDEQDQYLGSAKKPSRGFQVPAPYPTPFQATFSDYSAISLPTPTVTSALSNQSSMGPSPDSASPSHPFSRPLHDRNLLVNNSSTLSLRNKGLLTPTGDLHEISPQTPSSFTFTASSPAMMTSPYGGDITPSGPKAKPRPLEPCPEAQILRPYWLLRCFHQTIVHPDGGYLTSKLCIPRKAWQVANVKLKHVEDKVANCDLLTAALLKLGLIDTLDADAVLQEMESFESVMTQVQTSLSKKLGNEVGPQNIASLFKEAPVTSPTNENGGYYDMAGSTYPPASGKASGKGYFSLRKLRGKASDAAIAKTYASAQDSFGKDATNMASVPMTSSLQMPSLRGGRREVTLPSIGTGTEIRAEGPNANYMSALAKLCDAAQVLDQIARQVEDPGLKLSSPTHVGLELSSKHASEFFGLYICRFVLQDVTMLAEKHVKRASEYALN